MGGNRDRWLGLWGLVACLALAGCAAPIAWRLDTPPPSSGDRALRVVSYNVALGALMVEPDARVRRVSRQSSSIRAALWRHPGLASFDVLGLQEVCSQGPGSDLEVLQELDELVEVFFARADPLRDGECRKGQAIVSRHPIVDRGVIRLPSVRRVGRVAIWADIALPSLDEPVRIYNVHLDNRAEGVSPTRARWLQMRRVMAHIHRWRAAHPDAGLIVLGDFNNLGRLQSRRVREETIQRLSAELSPALSAYESTHLMAWQTDWIFYDGLELEGAGVVDVLLSDHYPVVADFALPARRPPATSDAPARSRTKNP